MQEEHPNPLMAELSEQDYQQWKHHPVTKALFKFLADKSADHRAWAVQLWENRALDAADLKPLDEARVRISCYTELNEIKMLDIRNFYAQLGFPVKEEKK